MKKAVRSTVLAAASLLVMPVLARQQPAPTGSPTMSAIADAMGVREKLIPEGVVQSVDMKNRPVTIKSYPEGNIFTIKVGPEVGNLAQIGPGSVVEEYPPRAAIRMRI